MSTKITEYNIKTLAVDPQQKKKEKQNIKTKRPLIHSVNTR